MPWATMYSTSACSSSWCRPSSSALRTTARATLWGKGSSRQAAVFRMYSRLQSLRGTICVTWGQAEVSVPVLSKTMVSALANSSMNFPPLIMILRAEASFMAEMTEMGVASLMAQE